MNKAFLCVILCSAIVFSSCAGLGGGSQKDLAGEYYALAEGYAGLSKYDKAIPYYEKAAKRSEYYNAATYGLARMYALTENWDSACKLLKILYLQDMENRLIASSYAYALASFGKIDEALDLYGEICRKTDDDSVLARNYAELLFIAKKYDETLEQIAVLKEKFPDTEGVKGIETLEKKVKDALNSAKAETVDVVSYADSSVPPYHPDTRPPVENSSPEEPKEETPK